jgi:UDP-2,3-diacylglucosamine pyrophosphatase LpxH
MTQSQKKKKKKYKSIFLSDIHLGTKYCNAELLLEFLKDTEAERYYLIGDIIDGWAMKNKTYWPQTHSNIIQYFLKLSKRDHQVIYITGNHDEFLREHSGLVLGNISLVDHFIHIGVNGKRYLLIHGDQFDLVTTNAKWLVHMGSWAYDFLMELNSKLQWIYKTINIRGFSLSAWAKHSVKEAVKFIGDYEQVVVDYASKKNVDGVMCGHIHHANITVMDNIEYMNTGDFVESCTAIVEHYDGRFELLRLL